MRIEGWEKRLTDFLTEANGRPFEWGTFDCFLFACDAVKVVTGEDPGAEFRGLYHDEMSAGQLIREKGGPKKIKSYRDLAERGAEKHGFDPVEQLFARRGDIALAAIDGLQALGVCTGRTFAFLGRPVGLVHFPLDSKEIIKVWRVG